MWTTTPWCSRTDAREPAAIIKAARRTLDPIQPVAVLCIGVLNFIEGPGLVAGVLRELAAALCPGSYLAIMQPAAHQGLHPAQRRWNELAALPAWLRDRAERGLLVRRTLPSGAGHR